MNTPDRVLTLLDNEVFVFGSNLAGRHGRGAALDALHKFGAAPGKGTGLHGRSYAIPTKDRTLGVLPLLSISVSVQRFIEFACAHPELRFIVTQIGCGLAGYSPKQIAPFFNGSPGNVILPECFTDKKNCRP